MKYFLFLCTLSLLFFSCEQSKHEFTVLAGGIDRDLSLVSVLIPENLIHKGSSLEVVNKESGTAVAIQMIGESKGVFVLDQKLNKGEKRMKYMLEKNNRR